MAVIEVADSSTLLGLANRSVSRYGSIERRVPHGDGIGGRYTYPFLALLGLVNRSVSRYGYIERQIPQYRLSLHQQTGIDSEFREVTKF